MVDVQQSVAGADRCFYVTCNKEAAVALEVRRKARKKQGGGTVSARVGAHRDRLRAQGLRPIQIWVPDVHAPGFSKEARRQSRLAARSRHAAEDQAFIDAVSDVKF